MSNVSLDNEEIQTYEEYAYLSHFCMTGNENREITRRILQAKKTVRCSPQWNLIRLRILMNGIDDTPDRTVPEMSKINKRGRISNGSWYCKQISARILTVPTVDLWQNHVSTTW